MKTQQKKETGHKGNDDGPESMTVFWEKGFGDLIIPWMYFEVMLFNLMGA